MWPEKVIPGVNGVHGKGYPVPLASHEDVVKDRTLFMNTLRSFHFSLGSKFLYVCVMLYSSFFGENRCHSFQAIGTIDAKFDCGYLVSVRLGNETLNGVLYHPAGYPPASASTHQPCNVIVPYTAQLHQQGRRARRRRVGDPGRPKPNRSGYNFFFAEKHSTLKSLYPNREREFTKMIGESWNNLPPEEREIYQSYGLKDKERYQKELKEYKERLKVLNSSRIMRTE
ncbi:High mobility group B protein 9 [Sesamum angolense]|uniref:High mobility group B protein 9 n=1 Tax=Sesamum angolense TaxID=2727404 RepID=A0AAE1WCJ6_9LAMI|nr:High mobility group B protein 9 [Sesamum angolense]